MLFATAGFLGTRASLMLDVVFLAMFIVLPLMAISIALAKFARQYSWHKRMQLGMAVVLLVAVAAFEVDMQLINNWRWLSAPESGQPSTGVLAALRIHLLFAITTPLLWIYVMYAALRKFPDPPMPGPHSHSHKRWGYAAAADMVATAITGWVFYYLAFVS